MQHTEVAYLKQWLQIGGGSILNRADMQSERWLAAREGQALIRSICQQQVLGKGASRDGRKEEETELGVLSNE
eukprot:1157303-Pelagomonas_calceolata.AAC.11